MSHKYPDTELQDAVAHSIDSLDAAFQDAVLENIRLRTALTDIAARIHRGGSYRLGEDIQAIIERALGVA